MLSKSTISLIIGIAVSLVTLKWAFRHVPLEDLLTYLTSMHYGWVAAAILTTLFSFVLRVLRWQVLLSAARSVPFWHAFHPLMIGFMVNCVLPGRVGELARPAILYQRSQVPYPTGLATVVAERLFDTVILLVLLAAVFFWVPINTAPQVQFGSYQLNGELLQRTANGIAAASVVLVCCAVAISNGYLRGWMARIINWLPRSLKFLGARWEDRGRRWLARPLIGILENAAKGLATIKKPFKVLLCLALSFGNWLLLGLSYYMVARGAPGIDLAFFDLLVVMIIICFFIALPSVPGFWGLWEAGGVFALALFGVASPSAAGYTLANHAVQVIPVMVVGFCSAIVTGVGLKPALPPSEGACKT